MISKINLIMKVIAVNGSPRMKGNTRESLTLVGEILKEKLRLTERQDRLLRGIKAAKDENKKKDLINKLKEVVSSRFDLFVREKQIAYKRLRDRLEELRKRVEESQAEIDKLMNPKTKKQNIDKRVDDLLKQKGKR